MTPADHAVVLDAYAAIRCPVKVQNYYDATITLPEGSSGYGVRGSSDVQQELFGGRELIDRTLAAHPWTGAAPSVHQDGSHPGITAHEYSLS